MACFHPLKGFVVGLKENGKQDLVVVPARVDHVEYYNGSWKKVDTELRGDIAERCCREFVYLPCGHCDGCRIDRSREWCNRLLLELQTAKCGYFITLTYDDFNLPYVYAHDSNGEVVNDEFGLPVKHATLVKRDMQLFMKRLRRAIEPNLVRFYLVGEYGEKSFRPHYHLIVFGLQLDDLKFYKRSKQGYNYFTSDFIRKVWPYGFNVIGEITPETCAYTARYVQKKLYGADRLLYEKLGIEEPFSLMSRKPGIGYDFYVKNRDHLLEYSCVTVPVADGAKKIYRPKYFLRQFELEFPEEYGIIRDERRQIAEDRLDSILAGTDLDYLELLEVEESNFKSRIKSLDRSDV